MMRTNLQILELNIEVRKTWPKLSRCWLTLAVADQLLSIMSFYHNVKKIKSEANETKCGIWFNIILDSDAWISFFFDSCIK